MQWLARICVGRPVFTWVLMLVILVLGLFSYTALGLDKYPKIDFPVVVVTTRLDGAAPEEVETEITDKIEEAVNTISGIDELRSTSSEGVSQVIISFVLEKSADVAAQEVRDHVANAVPNLPKGIDSPVDSKIDPDAAPVLYVTLRGPGTLRDLTELADKDVRRKLENIDGVGQVSLVGGTKRQIKVYIDPVALHAHDLTAADVQRAISTQNISVPGGAVERGPVQLTLRLEGKVTDLDELRRLTVRESEDHPTRLEDVAVVQDAAEDEDTWASRDGQRVVLLSVRKQSGENTVALVDRIRERLGSVQATLPPGAHLDVVRDNSESIRTSVGAVKEHLVVGALLAAVVVLLFLGSGRSTIIAAIAIPVSILGAFVLMWLLGFTLNMMTLLALALAVGIVIDDAIVVLENIVRFIEEKGMEPFRAAVAATQDIGLAVLATTLSLLAVFIPVSFMTGIVGRFLKGFGLTMASAILVSLFVSFTLTPMLCARWLRPKPAPSEAAPEGTPQKKSRLERLVDVFYRPIERAYLSLLRRSMARRGLVVLLCALALGSCVPLTMVVPKSFTPEDDQAHFSVNLRAPEGSTVQATRIVAERIARDIGRIPGVASTLVTIGDSAQMQPNRASIYVKLTSPEKRSLSQRKLMDKVRAEVFTKLPPELFVAAAEISDFGGSTAKVQYTLSGPDLAKLTHYTETVLERLRKVPGAVDVDSTLVVGKPEARVMVERDRAQNLGVAISDIATTLQLLVGGLKVSTYSERGEDYDIHARALREYRMDERGLLITVPSHTATSVPIDSVVRIVPNTGASQIDRLNRQRQVTITCNAAAGYGESTIQSALEGIFRDLNLPPGYEATPAGGSRETGKAAAAFGMAFAASFIFMYLVLAAQFESWLHPITILVSLPLTAPFALLSLLLFGQQITIFSALGLLVLFGVVKKNAILQVDHTNHLRAAGHSREDAILEANRDRLRPILMTTIAFVAGMLPLLFSRGVGAGLNRGIAGVIVGGQTLSLVLTLLATPVLYSLFDDLAQKLAARRARRRSRTA